MPAAAASPSSSSLRPLRPHRSLHSSSHHLPSYSTTSTAATSYRHEEDAVILELGSRYLRAGFEGESAPMCVMRISPENGRRVGDYRGWIDDDGHTTERRRAVKDVDEWCKGYELWNTDVRKVDVGLFEDKIERAIREIYNKYLLTDTGNSRIVLVLPSVVPHPALSALLSTIFNRWKHPSITLLPSATMAAVSAGLRSALVVDIGWEETVVTSIYEYREIKTRRSTRGMKLLMHKFALFLSHMNDAEGAGAANEDSITVDFDTVEEVVSRLAWCRRKRVYRPGVRENNKNEYKPELAKVSIPMPNGADLSSCLFGDLAEIVEDNLFVDGVDPRDLDDEELPVDVLVYNALLSLLPDARGMLMSRVIITGGGGEIPGVKQRIMDGVERLVEKYGWSPIRGAIIDRQKAEGGRKPKPKPAPQGWQLQQEPPPQQQQQQSGPPPSIPLPSIPEGEAAFHPSSAEHPRQLQLDQDQTDRPSTPTTGEDTILLASPPQTSPSPSSHPFIPPSIPARDQINPPNPIDVKLARQHAASNPPPPPVHGTLRCCTTLGAWAGASLTTTLKVRGAVEIERERFWGHHHHHSSSGGEKEKDKEEGKGKRDREGRRSLYGKEGEREGKGKRHSLGLGGWA